MLNFEVNRRLCTKCGLCIADCPAGIIAMADGFPNISLKREASCLKCQHCLAICPVGAISILGIRSEECRALAGSFPTPDQMESLIKGRRSVRSYKKENLEPDLMEKLLSVASYAPSGKNNRQVLFTVLDDREKLERLLAEIMSGLGLLLRNGALPKNMRYFADFVRQWEKRRIDSIFRGAPHLLIVSAPLQFSASIPDCFIALSYFELFAQSMGVGTLWDGWAKQAIELLPEVKAKLQIPEEHVIGYMMVFGKPAVQYARRVRHTSNLINRVSI